MPKREEERERERERDREGERVGGLNVWHSCNMFLVLMRAAAILKRTMFGHTLPFVPYFWKTYLIAVLTTKSEETSSSENDQG